MQSKSLIGVPKHWFYRWIETLDLPGEKGFLRTAQASFRLGNPDRAISRLEQGLRAHPGSAVLLEAYLRHCLARHDLERASGFLLSVHGSWDEVVRVVMGVSLAPEAQLEYVRGVLKRGAAVPSAKELSVVIGGVKNLEALWGFGDELLHARKRDVANEIYRELAKRPAETATEFMFAALSEYRLQNVERALATFEAGLRKHPDAEVLLLNFARVSLEVGRVDRLVANVSPQADNLQHAHEALFQKFQDPLIQVGLIAGLLSDAESRPLAVARVEIARKEFASSQALWELADLLLQNVLQAEADAIYRELAARPSATLDEFFYSALASDRLGDRQAAIGRLEAGLERFPQSDRLLEQLTRICAEVGQIERAGRFVDAGSQGREQICAVLFERFKGSAVEVPLIDYCLKHELLGLADQKLEFVKTHATNAMSLWGAAELYSRLARRNDAAEIYKRLSEREPSTPEDCYYAALGLLRLDKPAQCLDLLEAGQSKYGCLNDLLTLYLQICARGLDYPRYARFLRAPKEGRGAEPLSILDFYTQACRLAPVDFIVNLKDLEAQLEPEIFAVLQQELVALLREKPLTIEVARVVAFFCKYLDTDPRIDGDLFAALDGPAAGYGDEERRALRILHDLTLPMIPYSASDPEQVVRGFIEAARALSNNPKVLHDPISDVTANWTPWQLIFCHAAPRLYREAMSAFEAVAFSTWPRLDHVAPHVLEARVETGGGTRRRVRIGFNVHDSMPMMSGLLTRLDPALFETVYLRPGKPGQTAASKSWRERADAVVEYSDIDMYAAIETIAAERLDIIISGPAVAATFYPMMARLAPLQMVLLEPNWTDGLKNSDYYISWGLAEPQEPAEFYASAVAYFEHPPYWIEKPSSSQLQPISEEEKAEVRRRLLNCGSDTRVYLCANTPPKIHPEMDQAFADLLERDREGVLVFLRAEYKNLRLRLRRKLGAHFDRVVFVPALPREDAHKLLRAVDCCLDSFPLCGMSSSFDGAMLGVPMVTLPSGIPFGEWTSAIYKYIGVQGLTANSREDYVRIAVALAKDPEWRRRLSAELREKSSRFVESTDSSSEFQEFLLRAWERKVSGAAAANWIDGRWQ